MSELFVGIMTGTSLDAIDIALVDMAGSPMLLASHSVAIPFQHKNNLTNLSKPSRPIDSLSVIKDIEIQYTNLVAEALMAWLESPEIIDLKSHQPSFTIKAIGIHGVTICHEPNRDNAFSWQIIDAHRLAAITNIDVCYDFRSKDIALQGQGAPLVPMFHYQVFEQFGSSLCSLNLGGIANVSAWPNKGDVIGFDTGPANTLMDYWVKTHYQLDYDKNGLLARTGTLNVALLNCLLEDEYFSLPYPKSTGKELFNFDWLTKRVESEGLNLSDFKPQDVLCTLTHLTAKSVALSIESIGNIKTVAVCGGGVHNDFLLECITSYLPKVRVCSTFEFGLCPDNMEAMAFAWLAKCRIDEKPASLPSITGTKRASVLGAWVSSK